MNNECSYHSFPFNSLCLQDCQAGLNFASENEAAHFKKVVEGKLMERHKKRMGNNYTLFEPFVYHIYIYIYLVLASNQTNFLQMTICLCFRGIGQVEEHFNDRIKNDCNPYIFMSAMQN